MKKGQIVEGIVKKINFPNKGVIEIPSEDKRVIVKDVIAGQKVCVSIQKVRKGLDFMHMFEVIQQGRDQFHRFNEMVFQWKLQHQLRNQMHRSIVVLLHHKPYI